MNIFLVGFMGCGKSYVARNLAPKLGMKVVDLDRNIVNETGKSIAQIFEIQGEEAFRRIEQKCLHQLANTENTIISTGGGAACFFDNMEWMNAHGTSIFLDVSIPIIMKRLQKGIAKRPLLADKSKEELETFIAQKLEARRSYYEQASITHHQASEAQDRLEELLQLLTFLK